MSPSVLVLSCSKQFMKTWVEHMDTLVRHGVRNATLISQYNHVTLWDFGSKYLIVWQFLCRSLKAWNRTIWNKCYTSSHLILYKLLYLLILSIGPYPEALSAWAESAGGGLVSPCDLGPLVLIDNQRFHSRLSTFISDKITQRKGSFKRRIKRYNCESPAC